MDNVEDIGKHNYLAMEMYKAYGQTTEFKNYQGNPMPAWEDLPENIKKAWLGVSKQARHIIFGELMAKINNILFANIF